MRQCIAICGVLSLAIPATLSLAQATAPPAPNAQPAAPAGYVTREEYERMKAQLDAVTKDMAEMKTQQAVSQKEVDDTIEEIMKNIHNNERAIDQLHLGSNRFMLAGDGAVGFTAKHHENSTFDAGFAPLFLYELDKNIIFEGALDIAGETTEDNTSDTTADLVLANITFTVNDWLYVGGGVFAVPFGRYHTHFDASWINKLPDDPLAFGDKALGPSSETGVYLGGATPIDTTKLEYNLYIANGPNLIVNDPDAAGSLNFDDFTDLNGDKAVGGRIGFLPVPTVDVGYSAQYSDASPEGFDDHVHVLLQAVDAQYKDELDAIAGTLEVRGEWIWSRVDKVTYDPTGTLGFGPIRFNNDRNGGYVMVAYRPTKSSNKIVKNLEFVARYDRVDVSDSAPGGGNEDRYTFGIDYWVKPNVVLKVAYQFDEVEVGSGEDALMLQCAFGL